MTDLHQHIQATPLMDTHEHMRPEKDYIERGPDVLQDLFDNYIVHDLAVAGAPSDALKALLDNNNPDLPGRFEGVREAWERCAHTGYGEAVRLIARDAYGIEEITSQAIVQGQQRLEQRNQQLRQPGERLRILKESGHYDHIQIDDFKWACLPDASGPEFFLYDLSWAGFCNGEVNASALFEETKIEVKDIESLRVAMAALFAKYGPCAIAVKAQHAYNRTLLWHERDAADAERALHKVLSDTPLSEEERLCLGDWCWAQGVEFAIKHDLPFKIHTGYYAGHGNMPVERIRSGHLCALLAKYPNARFVLMHTAYPYSQELIALAKHYPNVYVDLCWAWSIDPFSACDFVRRIIHAVPSHKLFAFGGDTWWPNASVAYAKQARTWLTRALQSEVDDGLLSESQAMVLATRFMRGNQEACFDLVGTRAAIHAAIHTASQTPA